MPAASGHNAWFTAQSQEVAIAETDRPSVALCWRVSPHLSTRPESAFHAPTPLTPSSLRFSLSTVPTGAIGPHLRHGEAALATGTPRRGESKTVHTQHVGEGKSDSTTAFPAGRRRLVYN